MEFHHKIDVMRIDSFPSTDIAWLNNFKIKLHYPSISNCQENRDPTLPVKLHVLLVTQNMTLTQHSKAKWPYFNRICHWWKFWDWIRHWRFENGNNHTQTGMNNGRLASIISFLHRSTLQTTGWIRQFVNNNDYLLCNYSCNLWKIRLIVFHCNYRCLWTGGSVFILVCCSGNKSIISTFSQTT